MWTCKDCEYENEPTDEQCQACDEPRPAQQQEVEDAEDPYRQICVAKVVECTEAPNTNSLFLVKVDVGEANPLPVVTNAANVRVGVYIVVAKVGATVKGEEVKKVNVKGFPSQGMLCDAPMLGWSGGGAGAAVILPDSFPIGSRPPSERPRGGPQAA